MWNSNMSMQKTKVIVLHHNVGVESQNLFFFQHLNYFLILYCSVTFCNHFLTLPYFWSKKSQILCEDFHSVNIYPLHSHKWLKWEFGVTLVPSPWHECLKVKAMQIWTDCDADNAVCNTGAEINMQVNKNMPFCDHQYLFCLILFVLDAAWFLTWGKKRGWRSYGRYLCCQQSSTEVEINTKYI